jgi:hypothetical protein
MPRSGSASDDLPLVFASLKPVLGKHAKNLHVVADTAREYTLVSTIPSPMPPKKGERIYFGAIKIGKTYVSFHLFPLYMNPELVSSISLLLKKRMQGKTCFNFRSVPDRALLKELDHLVAAGFKDFRYKRWV